jgi:SAM-dependent methyltransferase
VDPVRIVEAGYDAIAETYLRERLALITPEEERLLERVLRAIVPDALVVELGCGPGVPFTAALAGVARVVAVDLSTTQLRLARARVPTARFVRADMATLAFRPRSVDAVVAFASIGHVPRDLHAGLYRSIASWLRPGGVFASQHPTGDNPEELEEDWLGAPMYFSHPDLEGTLTLLRETGFVVAEVERVRGRESDGSVGEWAGVIAHVPAA